MRVSSIFKLFMNEKRDARTEIVYTQVEFLELGGTDGSGANSRAKKNSLEAQS